MLISLPSYSPKINNAKFLLSPSKNFLWLCMIYKCAYMHICSLKHTHTHIYTKSHNVFFHLTIYLGHRSNIRTWKSISLFVTTMQCWIVRLSHFLWNQAPPEGQLNDVKWWSGNNFTFHLLFTSSWTCYFLLFCENLTR